MLLRWILFVGLTSISILSHSICLPNLTKEAPDERYQINGETVIDQNTHLMWQRCALGQDWDEQRGRCQLNLEHQRLFTWQQAIEMLEGYSFAGYDDWRLPNKNELNSLVDRACTGPAINETAFPDTTLAGFWTSTPALHSDKYAWQINFTTGTLIAFGTSEQFSLRLVRELE